MPNRESLKDSVYNRIMEDIFCYEYQAGDILNALRTGDPEEAQRCLALDLNDFGGLKISLPV